jgi:hypothetical protein
LNIQTAVLVRVSWEHTTLLWIANELLVLVLILILLVFI